MMKIIDLSQTLEPGMPQYPGHPAAQFTRMNSVEEHGFQMTDFHAVVHVGTHCDAPAHFIAGGQTMEAIPLDRFVGDAVIVDVTSNASRELEPSVLDGVDVRKGDIVLFRSNISKQWGNTRYLTDYPYFTETLAHELVAREIKAVGLDFMSPDPVEIDDISPVHHILLSHQIGIVENLVNLDEIQTARIFFSAAPLKIQGSDGAFARAFAIDFA